jgi:hypothetical protein
MSSIAAAIAVFFSPHGIVAGELLFMPLVEFGPLYFEFAFGSYVFLQFNDLLTSAKM